MDIGIQEKFALMPETGGQTGMDPADNKPSSHPEDNNPLPVTLNLRGTRFRIDVSELKTHTAGGRLMNLTTTDQHYDESCEEFVFNRNPNTFQAILDYYARGTLHFPGQLCHEVIQEELEFWRLPPDVLAPCCYDSYQRAKDEGTAMERIRKEILAETGKLDMTAEDITSWRMRMWCFLEYPKSSKGAFVWSIIVCVLIVLSLIGLCVVLQVPPVWSVYKVTSAEGEGPGIITEEESDPPSHPRGVLVLEAVLWLVLAFDVVARGILSPHKCRFFSNWLNILQIVLVIVPEVLLLVDIFMVVPMWLSLSVAYFQLLRMLLLFRLMKNFWLLRVLVTTTLRSWRELIVLLTVVVIMAVMFGLTLFLVESQSNYSQFTSMSNGMWWAIVTLTTVGYGDIIPMTHLGQAVGSVCGICGVFLIATFVAIIGINFSRYNSDITMYRRYKKRIVSVSTSNCC